jgi:hypothetical protein
VSGTYHEAIVWWLRYLRIFALNPPWGTATKFTIGVDAYTGERIAKIFNLTPKEVVDACGRPCLQVEPEERLVAIEWLKPKPGSGNRNPMTWGGASSADADPRSRYQRTASGGLELKKPSREID